MFHKKRLSDATEPFLQPPPDKRYVRSFLFARKIHAPLAQIHLIPRTILVLCLSSLQLQAISAAQPDLPAAALISGVCLLLFYLSGMQRRAALLYLLLTLPTLLSIFTTWILFNPVAGQITLFQASLYGGKLVVGLAFWEPIWLLLVALYFWRTRRLLGGIFGATLLTLLMVHLVAWPTLTLASLQFGHPLTLLVSDRSLLVATTKVVGYGGMVFATIALVVSSRDIELIGAMRQLHIPQPIVFFFSTVFRTLDLSLLDYQTIHQAQLARAINARPRSFIKRLRDMASIAVPMVAVMIRRSSEIGDALLARGYQLRGTNADFYETSPGRPIDALVLLLCLGMLYLIFWPHPTLTSLLHW